ncbi:cyclophilin-like fold protein [Rathayibacter sp. ZW T2_19]|uniref:Cyclophilin-like fold protein n=1 Tax=Rathayibacter rubneri TaxID=2950106 RepID=A0A9X2DVR5_9MICO|nr:cyclophilin-like fold protein [Rathayibacter rubneri]MCM6761662.1 cyclophilin-like fold protein [Rathayibacter rubneri]
MRRITAVLAATAVVAVLSACSTGSTDEGADVLSTPTTAAGSGATTPAATAPTEAAPAADVPAGPTAITLTAGDEVVTAVLNDSRVSQDLLAMLPAQLPWFRNLGIEYITELDAPLTETGPFYTDVQPGDIVYYNPADSLTIIYEETSSVPTLTLMGEVTSDLSVLRSLPDDVVFTVEVAE